MKTILKTDSQHEMAGRLRMQLTCHCCHTEIWQKDFVCYLTTLSRVMFVIDKQKKARK